MLLANTVHSGVHKLLDVRVFSRFRAVLRRERTLTLTVEHFWTGRFICHVRNVRGEYCEEQQYE